LTEGDDSPLDEGFGLDLARVTWGQTQRPLTESLRLFRF
jgi:hypothetical protein